MPDPVAWLVVERGWEVVSSDGEKVGVVHEVLADRNADIFDGLAVDPGLLKTPKYVPAERVGEIVEGRLTLELTKAEFDALDEYDRP
ncbi:MAG: PRC-barrel domain-containing protein [Actinomycetota bacterium]